MSGSVGRTLSASRPHTVLIDDAHACLNKADQAFRLAIPSSHDAYDKVLEIFARTLEDQSRTTFVVQRVICFASSEN